MPSGRIGVQARWCLLSTFLARLLPLCEWSCLLQMEEKYGCLRMVVLWLFSSLGGTPVPCCTPSMPVLISFFVLRQPLS